MLGLRMTQMLAWREDSNLKDLNDPRISRKLNIIKSSISTSTESKLLPFYSILNGLNQIEIDLKLKTLYLDSNETDKEDYLKKIKVEGETVEKKLDDIQLGQQQIDLSGTFWDDEDDQMTRRFLVEWNDIYERIVEITRLVAEGGLIKTEKKANWFLGEIMRMFRSMISDQKFEMTIGPISTAKMENLTNLYRAIQKCSKIFKAELKSDLFDSEKLDFFASSDSTKTLISIIVIFPKSPATFAKHKLEIRALSQYYQDKINTVTMWMNAAEMRALNCKDVRVNGTYARDGYKFPHELVDMADSSAEENTEPRKKRPKMS